MLNADSLKSQVANVQMAMHSMRIRWGKPARSWFLISHLADMLVCRSASARHFGVRAELVDIRILRMKWIILNNDEGVQRAGANTWMFVI